MLKKISRSWSLIVLGTLVFMFAIALQPSYVHATPSLALDETPTPTPTATPTAPATNATVTLALPGGGDPVGRAGTKVQINGAGFSAGSNVSLFTVTDPAQCTVTNTGNLQSLTTRSRASVRGDGTFEVTTDWPDNANQPSTTYYVCVIDPAKAIAAYSNKPFTVAQPPTASADPKTVNQGDKLTITGTNWLPAQKIAISISEAQAQSPKITEELDVNSDGSFSKDISIPKDLKPGAYRIDIVAINDSSLRYSLDNAFTVKSNATPTPSVTPTPTVTPTPEATPTPTPSGGSGSGGSGSLITLLIFGLGGLGIILVIIGLIMFITYSRGA